MNTTNPLSQFFRQPVEYFAFPSGDDSYSDDVLVKSPTGEHAVYAMTARDEITVKTPGSLSSGQALADLIKSCIPDVKDPWKLKEGDYDAALVAIKVASDGDNMALGSVCPSCGDFREYEVYLKAKLADLQMPDYDAKESVLHLTLAKKDVSIKFKPMIYEEVNKIAMFIFSINMERHSNSEVLSKNPTNERESAVFQEYSKKINDVSVERLLYSIAWINVGEVAVNEEAFIREFLQNIDKETFKKILNFVDNLNSTCRFKPIDIECSNFIEDASLPEGGYPCGHKYKEAINLNPTDFFA